MKTILSLSCLLILSLTAFGDETAEWISVLSSADAKLEAKARACQRLGEFGGEEAAPALAALLSDPVLNSYARAGLERIPGKKKRVILREALGTCKGAPLIGIVESLGTLGVSEAAEDLTKLVGHADAEVSAAALRSLGRMGGDSVPTVLGYLQDPSAEVRAAAATACLLAAERQRLDGDLQEEKEIYEAILNAEVPRQIRLAALRGAILTKRSIPFLMDQLRSGDSDVQDVAFLALRSFHEPGLAEALHRELPSAEGRRQVRLVHALRDCANADTIEVLVEQLAGATGELRLSMIQVLGHLGGIESAAALLKIIDEEEAVAALTHMKGAGIDERIMERLKSTKEATRRVKLINLLGDRRSGEAVDMLLEQARENDFEIRKAALRALRPLVGLPHVPELISQYKASDSETKSSALNALVSACRQSDPPEPAGNLILSELDSATGREDRRTWMGVLAAIGHAPALPVIAKDLDSVETETVTATIQILGRWPDSAPIDALIPVGQKPAFRAAALRSILTLIERSKDSAARLAWLKNIQPLVASRAEKQQFISRLATTIDKGSLELLKPYLQDEEVKGEAVAARRTLSKSIK